MDMQALFDRPQGVGRVLDAGFRLFRAGWGNALLLGFIAALLGLAPQLAGELLTPDLRVGQSVVLLGAGVIVLLLVNFIVIGALIAHLAAVARGQPIGLGVALRTGLRRLFSFSFSVLFYLLAVLVGMLLFLVPGIILSVSLMLAMCAVIIDGDGPVAAVRRSHRLVWGSWWRTAAVLGVAFALFMIFTLGFQSLAAVAALSAGAGLSELTLLMAVVSSLGNVVGLPLFDAVAVALYHDLKLRREGADLTERLDGTLAPA